MPDSHSNAQRRIPLFLKPPQPESALHQSPIRPVLLADKMDISAADRSPLVSIPSFAEKLESSRQLHHSSSQLVVSRFGFPLVSIPDY
jgi:hypothetical protein